MTVWCRMKWRKRQRSTMVPIFLACTPPATAILCACDLEEQCVGQDVHSLKALENR